jgi:MATE family multidrug resistance protein
VTDPPDPSPDDIEVPAPEPVPLLEPPPDVPVRANAWRELGEVLWLSLPIIITMLSFTLMHVVDSLMLSKHSTDALAAVMPASTVFFLFASLVMGTLSITNTFVSQCLGRGEEREGPGYAWQALYVAAAWGTICMLLWPVAPHIFRLAEHGDAIRALELGYFRILIFRMPSAGAWFALASFFQATKRPVVPMIAALIGNGLNIALDYVLIFGAGPFPEMGIRGAAIATVLGSYCQSGMLLAVFLSAWMHRKYGTRSAWRFDLTKAAQLVRVGLPAGLSWSLENVGWSFFVLFIIGSLGADALAANNAAIQVVHLSFMPVIGLNIGVQAVVGRHIGMKDWDGAKRRAYRALAVAVCYMTAMGVLFLVTRRWVMLQFAPAEGDIAGFRSVVEKGATMLIFAAVFQAFDAVAIICYGALKGAGDTRFVMLVNLSCAALVFVPSALLLTQVFTFGVAGAWASMTLYIITVAMINLWRFHSDAWRRIDVFGGAAAADAGR